MNRNFIFVFILLAIFSIVNAVPSQLRKRVTTFEPCPVDNPPVLDVTKVVPDPIISGGKAKFDISGTLPKAIPKGAVLSLAYYDLTIPDNPILIENNPLGICTPEGPLDCPYAAKTLFEVVFTNGAVPLLPPTEYGILITLEDATNILACARSFVTGSQP